MSTGRTAAAAIVGWSAMGVLFALPELQTGAPWPPVLKNSLAAWWAWGLVALLMAALDRRLPLTERPLGWRLAWHVPAGVVLTIFHAYAAAAVAALLGTRPLAGVFHWGILIRGLQGMMLWSLLVYWLILGGWLAKQYYQRYLSSELRLARLERLSTEARMHALRLQLDPHFLFNALNTISSETSAPGARWTSRISGTQFRDRAALSALEVGKLDGYRFEFLRRGHPRRGVRDRPPM